MIRVAKRGYIEVPSRLIESTFGAESDHYPGYYHHRWFVDLDPQQQSVEFHFKSWLLLDSWKYHLPKRYLKRLSEADKVSWLFWENSFDYKEVLNLGGETAELEAFVRSHHAYSPVCYRLDALRRPRQLAKNIVRNNKLLRPLAEKLLGRAIDEPPSPWQHVIHSR
jgi:hypothetical protein